MYTSPKIKLETRKVGRPRAHPAKHGIATRMPLRLHSFDLRIDADASSVEVSEYSHALSLKLVARWASRADVTAAQKLGLLDDYLDADTWADETVELLFAASGVFEDVARPAGRFAIVDGKYEPMHDTFYVNGLAYGLELNGELVFDGGEVRFAGRLKPRYEPSPDVALEASLRYDVGALDLADYQWTTLAELAYAPAERVRRIWLRRVTFEALPEGFWRFTHLRHLALGNFNQSPSTDTLTLPEWIGEYAELEELHLRNAALRDSQGRSGAAAI